MRSPFKFLDSYERKDRDIFFGREKEIATLYDLVNQNRLVLLYGPSGTGKTSLIQCGLANRFHPTNWFPIFVRRGTNLNESLKKALEHAQGESIEGTLSESIEDLYAEFLRPICLIFDQFEEIFVLGKKDEQDAFIADIAALNAAKLPCQIIFSLREEYLAHLYPFEQVIPTLLDRRLRVEPMNFLKATEVIQASCAKFNINLENPEENARHIIDRVSAGRSGVSLPYLQVYLDRLYQEDFARTYKEEIPQEPLPALFFTEKEIDNLGDIGDVLKIFLQEQRDRIQQKLEEKYPGSPERAVRKILNRFASLEGTKVPRQKSEIIFSGISEAGLDFILDELTQSRILREDEGTYELAHDTLSLRISEQRSAVDIALIETTDLIQGRMWAFERTGAYLAEKELQLIDNYKVYLKEEDKLSAEAWNFVNESHRALRLVKRNRNLRLAGVMALLITLFVFSALQWRLSNSRLEAMKEAQVAIVNREMKEKDKAISSLDYELAYEISTSALSLNTYTPDLEKGLIEQAYYYNEIDNPKRLKGLLEKVPAWQKVKKTKNKETFSKTDTKSLLSEIIGKSYIESWDYRYFPKMVPVEGGRFLMGSPGDEHQVEVSDFEIGKFEVTVYQYEIYLKSEGKTLEEVPTPLWFWQGNDPIVFINWYDATLYCNWLSKREGLKPYYVIELDKDEPQNFDKASFEIDLKSNGYRLPTEAEWEYAAAGGRVGRDANGERKLGFAGSDSLEEVAWYKANSNPFNIRNRDQFVLKRGKGRTGVRNVGEKKPNELGLHDMIGNLWEWCGDWWGEDYYEKSVNAVNPLGPSTGDRRTLRGGSWNSNKENCTVYERGKVVANYKNNDFGFRVARNKQR